MNITKSSLLWISLCAALFLSSCSKDYLSIEIFVKQIYSRPAHYEPKEFDKQPNIVIMGDGYTVMDFGSFEAAADNLIEHLFSVRPFNIGLFPE
ncbi:MAG: M64 family metallopeptidase, partial [Bacteroidales bacterium]|nr:M64 family metallopeptidase [Bacteroidales bacterium]